MEVLTGVRTAISQKALGVLAVAERHILASSPAALG